MIDKKELGRRIAQIRKLKGLTQEVVSERLGLSASGVASIETGRSDASLTRLQDIAKVLDMQLIDLLFGEFDGIGMMRKAAVPDHSNFDPIQVFTDPDLRSLQAKLKQYETRAMQQQDALMDYNDLIMIVGYVCASQNVDPKALNATLADAENARLPTLGLSEDETKAARGMLRSLLHNYLKRDQSNTSQGETS